MASLTSNWTLGTTGAKTLTFDLSVDADNHYSKNFGWAVKSDFTVVTNYTGATVGNHQIFVEGSVDGTNWFELDNSGSAAGNSAPQVYIYDIDTKGIMPYMRLKFDPSGNWADADLKVVVNPHLLHH